MANPVIPFEEGWRIIKGGMDKIVSFVDAGGLNNGESGSRITPTDYVNILSAVYTLCTQNNRSYCMELYSRYEAFFQNYIHSKILPAVREKSGELLLREMVKQWKNYEFIARRISSYFHHLKYHTERSMLPTMHNTSLLILKNQVYEQMKEKIIGAVLLLINEDREGNSSIDRALIKEVLVTVYDLQSEILNVAYQIDFEPAFFDSSCAYYLTKMDNFLQNLPLEEYMSQVVECMNAEKSRAKQYLHPSTLAKLLELVKSQTRNPRSSDVNCLSSKVQQLELGSNIG